MSERQSFAIVGLGKIGANLAAQALEKGFAVFGHDRHPPPADLVRRGLQQVAGLKDLAQALVPPRIVLLYVPAGHIVDDVLDQLGDILAAGDVIADGGNSYWGDTIRRHHRLRQRGIHLVDVGTSGGVPGAHAGSCFMVGGDDSAVAAAEPILRALAVEGGYVHAGPSGAGHFVKLVHNGVLFGMLQAIGEGLDLLEHYPVRLPVADVLGCWRHGSVIRSWLIDLLEKAYRGRQGLETVDPYLEDTGEVHWLIDDGLRMEVAMPVIAAAVMQLISSRDARRTWARAIAAMRHEFGGHPFGRDEAIARERHSSRIGGFAAGPSRPRSNG